MIGLDRTPFTGEKRGDFLKRLKRYAKLVKHITCIIYTPNNYYKTKCSGNIKLVPSNSPNPIWFKFDCLQLAGKEKFDLIVTQDDEFCGHIGHRLKEVFKKPLVVNIFSIKPKSIFWAWLGKRILKNADLVRCESKIQEDWLRKKDYKGKIIVAPIGFDLDKFKPPKKRKAKNTVLYVGRLSPEKNVEMIIEAAKLCTDVMFVIVGDGSEMGKLQKQAKGLPNIIFKGIISHDLLKAWYDVSNLLVLTSRYEGLPTVIVEAMSNGLPVISTDLPDVRRVVRNGIEGFLVKQGDVSKLVDCIRTLIEHSSIAEKMGKAGRRRVLELFGGDSVVERVVEGWKSVIKS